MNTKEDSLDNLEGLLADRFDISPEDAQLSELIDRLLGTGRNAEEVINDLDADDIAAILNEYSGEDEAATVVDSTDGVEPDENEALYQAIMAMDEGARSEFLSRFNEAPVQGPACAESAPGEPIKDNGNALAKLLGNLRF